MKRHDLLRRLGCEHPLLLAPMGGGPGTPELAAAVSNAGGLGALGVAYLTPEQILAEIRRTRELTSGPVSVNLFAGGRPSTQPAIDATEILEILREVHSELQLPPPTIPPFPRDPFADQLAAVREARPEVFTFTFGALEKSSVAELQALGIAVLGTGTTVDEARILVETGVDGVVAQGGEAGAHRGTFAGAFESSMVPAGELVRAIARFAPVVASGGLMDGRDVRAVLELGAAAAQLGTAFLPCPESGASPAYRESLLAAKSDTTVVTRAFSGRPARGLRNDFIQRLAGREHAILPYPLQNALTRPMRTASARLGRAEFLSLWAGQGAARCRSMPAAALMNSLLAELDGDSIG